MKGGLESQGGFGGKLPGPWPQEGRMASGHPLAACRGPRSAGDWEDTLPSFKTVSHLFLGTEPGALCMCVSE